MKKEKKPMKRKRNDPYAQGNTEEFLYERFSVMSATECTGLIPSEPENDESEESYKHIYDIN